MRNYSLLSDLELIQAYRQGENGAADVLSARYWPKVRDLARRYMRVTEDAEDVSQEVFMKLFVDKKIFNFQGQSQFWSWLFRIVANACKSKLLMRKRRGEVHFENWKDLEDISASVQIAENPETLAIQNEEYELLAAAFTKLKPFYQQGVSAIYFENQRYADASKGMGISLHTLGVQVMRAKSALSKWIRAEMDFLAGNAATPPPEANIHTLPEAA